MEKNKIFILDSRGEIVNFHISNEVKLVTLSEGQSKVDQGFRVTLPPDITDGGLISVKLKNGKDSFQVVPIFPGGFNDYLVTEINSEGHTIESETVYIGY